METVIEIVQTILVVYASIVTYRIAFLVIGFFFLPRKFKHTNKLFKYAVIIAARNEELVIAQLIDSIKKQNYPQELISIFVVAHNCKDKTAEIALSAGATVYEYNNPKHNRKGYAFRHLLAQIEKDVEGGIKAFDGYFVFDADNLLDKNCIWNATNAFANEDFDFFMLYQNTKNFGTTPISSYSSMQPYSEHCGLWRGKSLLRMTHFVRGPGALFRTKLLQHGWNWLSLTEDSEYTYEFISKGYRSTTCEAAFYFDERPLSMRIFYRQQMRWMRGGFMMYFKFLPSLIKGIFLPYDFKKKFKQNPPPPKEKRNFLKKGTVEVLKRLSCVDIILTASPMWMLTFVFSVLYPLGTLIYGIFSPSGIDFTHVIITLMYYYFIYFANLFILNFIVIVREHRKMRISPIRLYFHMFLWPLIGMSLDFVCFAAVFWPKRVIWKPIPRAIDKTIDDIDKEETLAIDFSRVSKTLDTSP